MLLVAGAGAIAHAITGDARLHWLALHLALLGGVSQLVLGAGQFFVCAFLATTPPSRRVAGAQLATWNTGILLVALGVPTGLTGLTDAGGILIVAGLVLFASALRAMQRRSLQRARWAVRWYQASAACLGAGALIGILLARGVAWPRGSLLGAHLALNLAGWLGTAIVGTLHTFFPSLTGTRLRFPQLQGPTLVLWMLGVVDLALGAAFAATAATAVAWLELAGAAALLAVNLGASLQAASIPLSLAARLVALAQLFLLAGIILALIASIGGGAVAPFAGATRAPLAILLIAGWIGMTVAGSLLHLLAVLARVRQFRLAMPEARPARDRLLAALTALAVAAWALSRAPGLDHLEAPTSVVVATVAGLIGGRILVLAFRATRGMRRQEPGWAGPNDGVARRA